MALAACAGPLVACTEGGPDEVRVALVDLHRETLTVGARDIVLFRGRDRDREVCAVLGGPIETSPGTSVQSWGGSFRSQHDVGTRGGCLDISVDLPRADDKGVMTFEARDSTHRIVVEATDPTALRLLSGNDGRYARGGTVPLRWSPLADVVTNAVATLGTRGDVDGVASSELSLTTHIANGELLVDVPGNATPGRYRLVVNATATPRIFRCDGVAACVFAPAVAAPRPLGTVLWIEVE